MNFISAVQSGFENYINFSGRATRPEYWYWCLFILIGSIITICIDGFIINNLELAPINLIFSLATFLPGLSVSIRRLHDINRSGWWLLITFTGIGILLLIYWALLPSKDGDNSYS